MGRLVIWTVPRSKSTIILKALSSNSGIKCVFEPFMYAFFAEYYEHRFSFDQLYDLLNGNKCPFNEENLVWKDIPSFVENLDFGRWFAKRYFKHALLVRNPEEVSLSKVRVHEKNVFYMNYPEVSKSHPSVEENFDAMAKLKTFLEINRIEFKVFDTTNLSSENSQQFLQSLCEFGDLPFKKESSENMSSFSSFPDHWWTPLPSFLMEKNNLNPDFHGKALQSVQFKHKQEDDGQNARDCLSEVDEKRLSQILHHCKPIYESLILS